MRQPLRLLVVEPDRDTLRLITEYFALEGCQVSAAQCLEDAFELVETATFHLVVAGVDGRCRAEATHLLTTLSERCKPTPVGAIGGWVVDEDAAELPGLAFGVPRSLEPEALLARVSGCLEALAREAPEPQRAVALAYFAALAGGDWAALGALVEPDFAYVFSGLSGQELVVRGREAFLELSRQTFAQFVDTEFTDVVTYPAPGGLVARYLGRWRPGPGQPRVSLAGAVAFQFAGARLREVSVSLNDQRLRALTGSLEPHRRS